MLTGFQNSTNITSCGNEMHVVFTSDNNAVTGAGYYAKIHVSADGNCSTLCSDKHSHCGFWESQGYCQHSYVAYMSANCQKSCSFCQAAYESLKTFSRKQFFWEKEINHQIITTNEKTSSSQMVKPPFGPEHYLKESDEKKQDTIQAVTSMKRVSMSSIRPKLSSFEKHGHLKRNVTQRQIHLSKMLNASISAISVSAKQMICPEYETIGNGNCDQANNKLVCLYDGGDCNMEGFNGNCTTFECLDEQNLDPCPKYQEIGNGQCDMENFNIICSFDGGDCKKG